MPKMRQWRRVNFWHITRMRASVDSRQMLYHLRNIMTGQCCLRCMHSLKCRQVSNVDLDFIYSPFSAWSLKPTHMLVA